MGKRRLTTVVVGLILAMVASTGLADALTRAADDLVDDQAGGNWGEAGLVGESTIGLVHAYELTGNTAYRTAAESAGQYSLDDARYNSGTHTYDPAYGLYPVETYSMARLSAMDPSNTTWSTALTAQLDSVNAQDFVDGYLASAEDHSPLVYNLARIAVAADYAGHADKDIYRNGVKSLLATVDDATCYAPVMALGAAVWSLASTGDISTDATEVWSGVQVKDLPQELADLQAGDGSFFALFNSSSPDETETTAMATLGLMTADATLYAAEIADAVGVLESGVGDDGEVYSVIAYDQPGYGPYYYLAGETLEVIPEPATMTMLFIGAVGVIRRRRSK